MFMLQTGSRSSRAAGLWKQDTVGAISHHWMQNFGFTVNLVAVLALITGENHAGIGLKIEFGSKLSACSIYPLLVIHP